MILFVDKDTTLFRSSSIRYRGWLYDLKANGFDVIVFVPSYDEDNGLITCGNAILSGKLPTSEYEIIE